MPVKSDYTSGEGTAIRVFSSATITSPARKSSLRETRQGWHRLCRHHGSIPVVAPDLCQQPQDFQIHPDQSDQKTEPTVPFHVLGGLLFDSLLNEVEVQNEVQRCDDDDDQGETDAYWTRLVDIR